MTNVQSRRILLVDNDRSFHRLLSDQFSPYGFEVVLASPTDPDVLTRVTQLAPEILIIAVDEPDKVGYSLCNKAKKGVAAKLPVILATSTVSAEGFANHRRLKIHADEYVDKRGLNPAEIVGKVDNLIGLGELVHHGDDDELHIPVEVEDVPLDLADAEVVEQLDDVNDFADEGGHTAIAPPRMVDAMLESDLDGAFAAITDFADEPAPMQAPAPRPAPSPTARPAPAKLAPPPATPAPILEDRSHGIPEPIDHHLDPPTPDPEELVLPAAAAIVDDLEASEVPASEWSGGEIPEPVELGDFDGEERTSTDLPDLRRIAMTGAAPVAAPVPVAAPEPVPVPVPVPVLVPDPPTLDLAPEHAPPPVAAESSGLDFGLDEVAARADAEQSGVHDRRTLQKVHLLERENTRLKADLDKQKKDADGGKKEGRERDFLHLREMIATKDKEILELRDELVVKDRQILDGKEKIRQLQHTRTQLEGKNLELEQRIVGDADKVESSESARKDLEIAVADLTAKLDAVEARARTDAEVSARALAEKVTAASALDKELTAARGKLVDTESKHADAIDKLNRAREAAEAKLRAELERTHTDAIEAVRTELAGAHATRVEALEAGHRDAVTAKEAEHAAAIAAVVTSHEERHAETASEHAAALAAAKAAHEQATAATRAAHDDAIAAERARADQAVAEAATHVETVTQAERARAEQAVADTQQRAQDDLVAVMSAHQSEIDKRTGEHAAALVALAGEHAATVAGLKDDHASALAQHRASAITDRDRLVADHGSAIAALTADRDTHAGDLAKAREDADGLRRDIAALAERAQRDLAAAVAEVRAEKAQVEAGLSSTREKLKGIEAELAAARDTIATREADVAAQVAAVAERDARIAAQKHEMDELESENAGYQEQVLKAYQKIKADESTVARAKKAMAIALTLLDEDGGEKKKGPSAG